MTHPHQHRESPFSDTNPSRADSEDLARAFEHLRELMDRYEWAVQAVGAEGREPGWCYTIGLAQNFQHPELCIDGLHEQIAGRLLNNVGTQISQGYPPLRHGGCVTSGDGVILRAVTVTDGLLPASEPNRFNSAWVLEPEAIFSHGVIQLVWPDRENRYPWDEGFRGTQTVWGPTPPPCKH